jgi:hypothetical protein
MNATHTDASKPPNPWFGSDQKRDDEVEIVADQDGPGAATARLRLGLGGPGSSSLVREQPMPDDCGGDSVADAAGQQQGTQRA